MTPTEITTHGGTARFPGIRSMVEADLRGWLPLMGVVLGEEQIGRILQDAEQALSHYVRADGRVEFPVAVHLATARELWRLARCLRSAGLGFLP